MSAPLWADLEALFHDALARAPAKRAAPEVTRGRWQVSTGGGTRPLWARSGQELFYLAPTGAVMRVAVASSLAWTATTPTQLFGGRYYAGSVAISVARTMSRPTAGAS